MLYENGKDKLKTTCGLIFTVIMVCIITGYAGLKANVMIEYLNNTIQEPIEENHFGLTTKFHRKSTTLSLYFPKNPCTNKSEI